MEPSKERLKVEELPVLENYGLATRHHIIFISERSGKLYELEKFFQAKKRRIIDKDLELPEIQSNTTEEVIADKCLYAIRILEEKPFIVEHTSLHLNALDGLPGPSIKWFHRGLGSKGLVKLLNPYDDKSAIAVTMFGFWNGKGTKHVQYFRGETRGTIVDPRGCPDFDWDDCFLPEHCNRTYGEMSFTEKISVSQRGKALKKLWDHFSEQMKERETVFERELVTSAPVKFL